MNHTKFQRTVLLTKASISEHYINNNKGDFRYVFENIKLDTLIISIKEESCT